jgi:hypothetical protein
MVLRHQFLVGVGIDTLALREHLLEPAGGHAEQQHAGVVRRRAEARVPQKATRELLALMQVADAYLATLPEPDPDKNRPLPLEVRRAGLARRKGKQGLPDPPGRLANQGRPARPARRGRLDRRDRRDYQVLPAPALSCGSSAPNVATATARSNASSRGSSSPRIAAPSERRPPSTTSARRRAAGTFNKLRNS